MKESSRIGQAAKNRGLARLNSGAERVGRGYHGALPVLPWHGESDMARGIRRPSESIALQNLREITSALPSGARLSPTGDIGLNRQREARKVFPRIPRAEIQKASARIPAKRSR